MFDPKKFEETVNTVAAEDNDADDARMNRRKAEAELLTRVIELARPALRAIGTRPVIRYHVAHHADVNYCGGVRTEERYKYRCVPLSDSAFGPEEDCPRANEGTSEGKDLGLREDGVLIQLEYSGDWSRWQGSSWGWEAEITEYADVAEALADGWHSSKPDGFAPRGVERYVNNLATALETAVGKRKARAEADRKRAEKVTAVGALLAK